VKSRYLFSLEHMLLRLHVSGRRVPGLLYSTVEEDLSLANEEERIPICRVVQINLQPICEKRCHTQPLSQFDAEEGLDTEGMLRVSTNMDEWRQEEEEDPQNQLDITGDDGDYEVAIPFPISISHVSHPITTNKFTPYSRQWRQKTHRGPCFLNKSFLSRIYSGVETLTYLGESSVFCSG
jgi:hypothetical protein